MEDHSVWDIFEAGTDEGTKRKERRKFFDPIFVPSLLWFDVAYHNQMDSDVRTVSVLKQTLNFIAHMDWNI